MWILESCAYDFSPSYCVLSNILISSRLNLDIKLSFMSISLTMYNYVVFLQLAFMTSRLFAVLIASNACNTDLQLIISSVQWGDL